MKAIYSDLPKHLPKIFEPRAQIRVKDLKEINIEHLLSETYTITPIQADKKTADGATVTVIYSRVDLCIKLQSNVFFSFLV